MMGDRPSELDSVVFGFISQLFYHANGSPAVEAVVKGKDSCLNIGQLLRMYFKQIWI